MLFKFQILTQVNFPDIIQLYCSAEMSQGAVGAPGYSNNIEFPLSKYLCTENALDLYLLKYTSFPHNQILHSEIDRFYGHYLNLKNYSI